MSGRSNNAPVIVGAGLAGLIAAHAWPTAKVFEVAGGPAAAHAALLRFRSDAVARLTGIEFRRVRVHKGIWFEYQFAAPSIRLANLYAGKVLGAGLRGDRSIWNLDPVDRYVAPDNFYEQLIDAAAARITWGVEFPFERLTSDSPPTISTAPLPTTLREVARRPGARHLDAGLSFRRAGIKVARWHLPDTDLYQTVYFPDPALRLYRASITGGTLIAEFTGGQDDALNETDLAAALGIMSHAFGIDLSRADIHVHVVSQRYGKIEPIPDALRKRLLFGLTHNHNIYSLGRFATWRNILLDDVVNDIDVIKRLLRASHYDLQRSAS